MTNRPQAIESPGAFLVEGFWPAGGREAFRKATARLEARLEALRNDGADVRVAAATLVPGDEAAYWVIDAPSKQLVAGACTEAGIRVDRIVDALELRAGKAVGPGRATVTARGGAARAGG